MKALKRDNSLIFLFTIIALFIVALVGFNFESMTSGMFWSRASLEISPKFINAGEYIEIKVIPGKGCVNRYVGIYDDSELRRETAKPPGTSKLKVCEPFTINYKTRADWKPGEDESGIFFIKVFDYGKEEYIKSAFTIRRE